MASCGEKTKAPIVARVENHVITADELGASRASALHPADHQDPKRQALQTLIDQRLKILEAFRRGLHRDKDIEAAVQDFGRRLAISRLFAREILDKYIPQVEVEAYYKNARIQVRASQILLKVPEGASEELVREVRGRIQGIYLRLTEGADFAEMARGYSEDPATASQGGDLGYLKWGPTSYSDELYRRAFALQKGEISQPFQTSQGFAIVKVVDRTEQSIPKFYQDEDRVREILAQGKRKELNDASAAYLARLERKYGVRFQEDAIKNLLAQVNPTSEEKTLDLSALPAADTKITLASYFGGRVRVEDLARDLQKLLPFQQPRFQSVEQLKSWIERTVQRELLAKEAYRRGLHKDATVRDQVRQYQERLMMDKVQAQEVTARVQLSDADYQKYFDAHRDEYFNPPRVAVQEILVSNEKLAESLARRAKAGESFTKLARSYNERWTTKDKDGNLGLIKQGDYGPVSAKAFQMQVGEISDPIRYAGKFSVIKVLSKRGREPMEYQEALPQVRLRARENALEEREKKWHQELRSQSLVVIYEKALAAVPW